MLVQKARKQGVNAHMLLLEGHADDAILEAADRLGVDLIVLGTRGRKGLARFFYGNVADDVTRAAPCPVLALRSSQTETEVPTRKP